MPSLNPKTIKHLINLLFRLSLILGIVLRFSYLDRKVFWHDEIYTQLRVSGYKNDDPATARDRQILSREQLLEFQQVSDRRNLSDTLASLEEDVHVPLYYVLLRYWQQLLGSSIAVIRAFSAVWGSLSLIGIYLLAKKLFEREEVARIATSLVAVSPTMIRYAQDARPYTLWLFCGVISTYALLSALANNSFKSWLLYILSIVATCYTQLLSLYLYIGHGLYVLITKGRELKTLVRYAVTSAIAVLLFLPWLLTVILPNFAAMQAQTAWLKTPMAFGELLREQVINLNHLFVSIDFSDSSSFGYYFLGILLVGLVVYAFYTLITQSAIAKWSLPLVFCLSSYVFLYQDLVLGGQRTRINQYFLFSYLAIFMAIGFLLGTKLTSATKIQQKLYAIIYSTLIVCALFTNVQTAAKPTWWGWSVFQADMAEIIDRADNPLIISQERIGNIMPLFHRLNDDSSSLKLDLEQQSLPQEIDKYDNIFVLNPPEEVKSIFRSTGRELNPIYQYKEGFIDVNLYQVD